MSVFIIERFRCSGQIRNICVRHCLVSKIKQLVHLVAKVLLSMKTLTFFCQKEVLYCGVGAEKDFVWNLPLFALLIPPIKLPSSSSQDQVNLVKFFKLVVHLFSFNWIGVR